MHYVLGFMVLMLFSVIQTIPRSLEEAALIHGASPLRACSCVSCFRSACPAWSLAL